MKKMVICCVCLSLLLGVTGCKKTESHGEEAYPIYVDQTLFLENWLQGELQIDGAESVSVLDEYGNASLIVPVIKTSDFIFKKVSFHPDYTYSYFFAPADNPQEWVYTHGVIIYWADEVGTFDAVVEQYSLVSENGVAYHESKNTLYLDKDGKCLTVKFPDTMPVTTEEELYSYFDFEEYSISGNSGEVQ